MPSEDAFERLIEEHIAHRVEELQKTLKQTGIICEDCGNPGASASQDALHNTGECRCQASRALCWREWWNTCQPP